MADLKVAAEPHRAPAQEVADDDPIGAPFPDRHIVDADDLRPGGSGAPQPLTHVLLLELLAVCHSRCSSSAMSLMAEERRRRPT